MQPSQAQLTPRHQIRVVSELAVLATAGSSKKTEGRQKLKSVALPREVGSGALRLNHAGSTSPLASSMQVRLARQVTTGSKRSWSYGIQAAQAKVVSIRSGMSIEEYNNSKTPSQ